MRFWLPVVMLVGFATPIHADVPEKPAEYIRKNYTRSTHRIAMRDGTKLHTIVYAPREPGGRPPILLTRTPYGIGPYEDDKFRENLGPNPHFLRENYIVVYQDVRGCYMSEGTFENMRPQLGRPGGPKEFDESTDTYDTIDWLVKNVPNNSGKVGQWGISYPGFYTAVGMIDAHPALAAASPQAPIADWYFDDFFHHGTFFLPHAITFFSRFGHARPEPRTTKPAAINYGTPDGYQFFLDLGSLRNMNPRYFKDKIAYWNDITAHPNYDRFWQDRNTLPHLRKVAPAVMTVGGWFDAEDLYGTFNTYQAIEKQNPGAFNVLVVGPWAHGAWSRPDATRLGNIDFGANTAAFYQSDIELPFFNKYLKGQGEHGLPEAYAFETGINRWRKFETWPPREVAKRALFLDDKGKLTWDRAPTADEGHDEFRSDPRRPVPYSERVTFGMAQEYMTDDQRFAARRPDVLVYETPTLDEDLTLAGPMRAELFVTTTGTDADWIVKVIDVYPTTAGKAPTGYELGGYQMLVRSEMFRGRFRDSFEKPQPFEPGRTTRVAFDLQDVLHTFKKGHRVMVQVSSTCFPLIDRNPQKYVPNIFEAADDDFIAATHRVERTRDKASVVRVGVLPAAAKK